MAWKAIGAVGDLIGAEAVCLTLTYLARPSSSVRRLHRWMRYATRNAFFVGPVWEVRRSGGIHKALTAEDAGALTPAREERRRVLGSPEAVSALDTVHATTAAIVGARIVAEKPSDRVVEQLRTLTAYM
ncbi:MAG: hypothetical protein P8188_01180 [Gemmatimonadota bacterium]